jgi:ribosome-associated translation inhibitor RaiA
LLSAFDSAQAKIETQLRKYKEKVQERHRGQGGRHAEPVGLESGDDQSEE